MSRLCCSWRQNDLWLWRVDMCDGMPWPRNISNFYVGFCYLLRVPYRSWQWIALKHFAAFCSYRFIISNLPGGPPNQRPGHEFHSVVHGADVVVHVCICLRPRGVMGVETKQPAEQSSKVEKRTQTDTDVEMDSDGNGKIPILFVPAASSLMISCFFPTAIPIQKMSLNQP